MRDNVTPIDAALVSKPVEAEEFLPGEFIARPSTLPPPQLIAEGVYDAAIMRALKLPYYHHGPRIVLVCEVLEGGTELCRFYQAQINDGRWQTKLGLQAHYPREARAIIGNEQAEPCDFIGLVARARVVTVFDHEGEPAYSKIHRLLRKG